MTKYHISPETGRPNICRAEKQDCPVGGSHFENKADAKAYAEQQLKDEHGGSLGKMSKKSSKKEQEDYQDGVNHAKDALIGGLDPDALLKNVSNHDSWDKGYVDTLKKASAFKNLSEEEKNRRSFDHGAFCFVCKRPVDHTGEHEALVNAGMAEYDSEYGVVRKTKAYFPAKAEELERKEAEYNANNPMSTEEIMNMAPPASLNKKNDAKKIAFGSEYSIDEKVDALKNFSNTNEYKKIMKEMGYKNPEDSMTQQVINGAYPTAVRSATKKLENNNKAGMKEYIRQLEEDAYEEEMNNVSRGYSSQPVYSSVSVDPEVEIKKLKEDNISTAEQHSLAEQKFEEIAAYENSNDKKNFTFKHVDNYKDASPDQKKAIRDGVENEIETLEEKFKSNQNEIRALKNPAKDVKILSDDEILSGDFDFDEDDEDF